MPSSDDGLLRVSSSSCSSRRFDGRALYGWMCAVGMFQGVSGACVFSEYAELACAAERPNPNPTVEDECSAGRWKGNCEHWLVATSAMVS